jgi:subtilisin-like proprotein convertase family protein
MNFKFLQFAGLVAAGLALALCPAAVAGPLTATGSASPGALIPDDNLNGLSSSITLNTAINSITGVELTVNVVGDPVAWNGDYFAYLQYSSGLVVLLNNLGATSSNPFGSSGNGFNVTFSDGSPNISSAPIVPLGTLAGTFAPQVDSLGTFDGLDPNGSWTLFIADESPGGVGKLEDWSLQVTGTSPTTTTPDSGGTLGLLLLGAGSLAFWSSRKVSLAGARR